MITELKRYRRVFGLVLAAAALSGMPGSGFSASTPVPEPPAQPGTPQAGAGAAAPGEDTAPVCPHKGMPLGADKVAGFWADASGQQIEIVQKDPKNATAFIFRAAYDWEGSYADGKLTFTRKPTAPEMSRNAPPWARKAVEGQLVWTLVLVPLVRNGTPELCGKWYPGRIEVEEDHAPDGTLTKVNAIVAGKGDPIPMLYGPPPGPHIFLYAETVQGRQSVDEFYVGVATYVEAQFDTPLDQPTVDVNLSVGGKTLKLVAKKIDDDGHIFRTDPFVPAPAASTETMWGNSPAPTGGQ